MTAYTALVGGRFAVIGEGAAGAGTFVLAAGIALRWSATVPWSIGLAGAGYVIAREHHAVVDGWATAVGAALLLAAELAAWSVDDDGRIHEEGALVVRRAATLGALVGASALVGFVLIGATAVTTATGTALTAVGVAAAVAAVAVVLRLLRA